MILLLHLAAACLAALLSKEQEEEVDNEDDDEGLDDSNAAEYDALGDGMLQRLLTSAMAKLPRNLAMVTYLMQPRRMKISALVK